MTNTNFLHLDYSAAEIKAKTSEAIEKSRKVYDQVAAVSHDKCTFASVILPLSFMSAEFSYVCNNLTFPSYVSTDKEIRDAASEAQKIIDEFEIKQSMREDVYLAIKAVVKKQEKLDDESARLLHFSERDGKRNGLALPKEQRDKLTTLKKQLADLSNDFSKNMNEDTTKILFTQQELDGLTPDFFQGREKQIDQTDKVEKYVVTMKYPDIIPILRMATNENTRKKMDHANSTKCQPNVKLLEQAIVLREQVAKLLGYKDHASYVLEVKMAKTTAAVEQFLTKLRKQLTPFAQKELARLLEVKKKEKAERKEQFDGKINSWDFNYYHRLLLEKEYAVDDQKIKEYFSMESVTKGMLELYQHVLSIKFTEIEKAKVWHQDVRLFEVHDKSGAYLGQFYLDLHPRDGKYSHAAVFGLQPGNQNPDGSRQYPVAAMVANFTKPTETKPSLLSHTEVITYFHELGHVMHQICSQTKYSRFHGTSVEGDFVEAPSQMLENWCWQSSILKKLSAHYVHGASQPLPEDLIQAMVKAKNVNAALMNLRQIFFGWFDFIVHTTGKADTTKLWQQLKQEVTLIPGIEGTWPAGSFGHVMGGYDAGYYGYLWSQVFSADMFYSRFLKEGVENTKTGLDYRNEILLPGGSRDGSVHLKKFLGRDPKDDAFLKSIGLGESATGTGTGTSAVL